MAAQDINIKILDRFTALVAFVFDANHNSLTGILDYPNKSYCIYLARDILDISDKEIGDYYRIYTKAMLIRCQDVQITIEVNDTLKLLAATVTKLWEVRKVLKDYKK